MLYGSEFPVVIKLNLENDFVKWIKQLFDYQAGQKEEALLISTPNLISFANWTQPTVGIASTWMAYIATNIQVIIVCLPEILM